MAERGLYSIDFTELPDAALKVITSRGEAYWYGVEMIETGGPQGASVDAYRIYQTAQAVLAARGGGIAARQKEEDLTYGVARFGFQGATLLQDCFREIKEKGIRTNLILHRHDVTDGDSNRR